MAPRLATSEERAVTRPSLPDPEVENSIHTLVAPIHVPTRIREQPIPNDGAGSISENQPTNQFRIKCLDELRSVNPASARKLENALDELPHVGDRFLGFHLAEVLGEGAFGTVFRAEQIGMASRSVALKISADLVGETQSLAQLQHTHIMPIYSAHAARDLQAICMPFYGRATLADWCRELRSSTTLPTSAKMIVSTLQNRHATVKSVPPSNKSSHHSDATAKSDGGSTSGAYSTGLAETNPRIEKMEYVDAVLWIGACIADGLAHAHQRGILHRDLKPANILLTDEGLPMILDFNLSEDVKVREAELRVRVGGTLPFMSPEQLEVFQGGTRQLDGRTDIYSLGLILFQLLTGHHPFRLPKGSPSEIVDKMLADRKKSPPLLTPYNPAISPAVESIVRRCLHANPAERYLDAGQLRYDIECHRENRPLKFAPNPNLGELFTKWVRRHPWAKSPVTIGLLCSVGLLSGVSAWVSQRDHFKREQAEALKMQNVEVVQSIRDLSQKGRELMLDWTASPEKLQQGVELLGQAIDVAGARQDANWLANRPLQILSVEEQAKVKDQIEGAKSLLEQAKKLMDPNKKEFQGIVARQMPAQIRSLIEGGPKSKVEDDKIPELSEANRRIVTGELMAAGRYREAVPYLRQSLAKKPNDFEAWFQLGSCLKMIGEHRDSMQAYSAALASRPDWIDALWNRAQQHEALGDLRSALLDVEAVIKLDAKHFDAIIQSAALLSRLNQMPEALARLEPAMNLPGVPTRIWFVRAEIKEHAKDVAGANADRAHGIELEPNDLESWNSRGYLRMKTAPEQALADLRHAEKLDPRSIPALQNQAYVYGERLNKPQEALDAIDRLLAHHPQYLPAVASRGVYLARLGQVENAVNQAKAALALVENAYTHFKAGCVYAKVAGLQPQYAKEAVFHLSKALMQGYGYDRLKDNPDLDPIRKDKMFAPLAQFALLMKNNATARK